MSPVGAIFVPFPPKMGTNMLHPLPPPIVELVRMVRYEVVEALLYGCTTWTPLEGHYTKLRSNTPFDVASNPRSMVQVAKQAYPLLQRHHPANRM